jgi:hypothetical protein
MDKAGETLPEPGRQAAETVIDDRVVRAVGIPAFALSISHVLDLYGPYGLSTPMHWVGALWFVLLSTVIWQANRWLLFRQREHLNWFRQRLAKIFLLLAGVVFGTIPPTVAMLSVWYSVALGTVDWNAIRTVTLVNVVCVLFVTHVYETVFLIKARETDLVEFERLTSARAEAELAALKAQVDPHFLFNALNTLGYLIDEDPGRARGFNEALARVYRYILASQKRHLVLLSEEMGFFEDYAALLRLRFGGAIDIVREDGRQHLDRWLLPPISLQLLLENAVKHNEFSRSSPLMVRIEVGRGEVVVENTLRPRLGTDAGAGVGLRNLAERYRLASHRDIDVSSSPESFRVRLPLLAA